MMILLKLADLSCQHCVKNVTKALSALPKVEQVKVSLHYARIVGDVTAEQAMQTVEQAGYQAEIATAPAHTLELSGLNCQHCIKSVRATLENLPDVVYTDVDLTSAKIYGDASIEQAIQAIEQAGFAAK
ncbi:cation transporter [Gallibacterium trehalosifermentans]|uniref:Cation transporter n=1 Tax=Gallibacterium trehalosifermentans TaxID=516935 RepID=A0ABV6H339_9PAST